MFYSIIFISLFPPFHSTTHPPVLLSLKLILSGQLLAVRICIVDYVFIIIKKAVVVLSEFIDKFLFLYYHPFTHPSARFHSCGVIMKATLSELVLDTVVKWHASRFVPIKNILWVSVLMVQCSGGNSHTRNNTNNNRQISILHFLQFVI